MKNKILVVIGGGGFLFQSTCLLKKLQFDHDCVVAIPEDSRFLLENFHEKFPECSEFIVIPAVTTIAMETNKLSIIIAFFRAFFASIKVLCQIKPNAVIIVASSIAIPMFLAAKLRATKTVFIESITRVDHLSTTGKLLNHLALADRLYVQWPDLTKHYPKAIYKGTVL